MAGRPSVNYLADNAAFCILPWIHLSSTVDGVWGRCCFDTTNDYDFYYEQVEEPVFTLKPDALGCSSGSRYARDNPDQVFGLLEAFNSPNMRRTRLAMLAGKRPSACTFCYERDDEGGESHRQVMNREYGARVELDQLVARTSADGSLDEFPIFLDIRLGNTCSLACIMCAFPVSSRLGVGKNPAWTTANVDPYRDDHDFWATLAAHAKKLRYLYLAGGEPFQQPMHFRLLDLLIDAGAASQIAVRYNSNLMTLPAGVFDKLCHFKSVVIAASCDGTDKVFETIRVGGRWTTFVQNVRLAKQHVEVLLDVSPQRDNVSNLRQLIEFAQDEDIKIRLENYIHYPQELSLRNLPENVKRHQSKEIANLIVDCEKRNLKDEVRQLKKLVAFMNLSPNI
ncbi:MAG: twitch domain-containing radical SAM protein [Actinobacteria bacterium]|nr:twitch domain-containing radical SAM protein [Actinomycetota bacterium]